GSSTTGGSATGGSATGGSSTGGSSTGGSGGSAGRVLSTCVEACTTAADCGTGTPADSAVNYRCENGGCVRMGCQNDTECNAQLAGNVCRPYPGYEIRFWQEACTGPETCGTDGSASWGPDNYTCTGGACTYAGCNSEAECVM